MSNSFKSVLIPIALLLGACSSGVDSNGAVIGLNIGNSAPEIAMNDTAGHVQTLSSLRGKVVLVDFWATWCGPCMGELPDVYNAWKKHRSEAFTIYSVSLDYDLTVWRNFLAADSLRWIHVADGNGWHTRGAVLYEVQYIPHTLLLDKSGIIRAVDLFPYQLDSAISAELAR